MIAARLSPGTISESSSTLPTGHYLMEEAPDRLIEHFLKFFTA
jgi:hypothetical protein